MSIAITLLSYEHGILRQVIDVLKSAAEGQKIKRYMRVMAEIVKFLDVYLDQFHHVKEEQFLFPAFIRASALLNDQIPMLIREHQQAKDILRTMANAIKQKNTDSFCETSQVLVEHMTSHINKEESIIYPRIAAIITPEENRRIRGEYSDFNKHFGPEFYKKSEEFAKRVQNEVLGPRAFKNIV
jgi:hemerythrin-like domain-containing protein